MVDGDAGTTAVRICRTVYVPHMFVPILLAGKLIPVKAWQRLWGDLVTANLEVDFQEVVDWI